MMMAHGYMLIRVTHINIKDVTALELLILF